MVRWGHPRAFVWLAIASAFILAGLGTAAGGPWTPATGTSTDGLYHGKDYADTVSSQPLVYGSGDWAATGGPPMPWSNIDISTCTTGCVTPALPDSYGGGAWSADQAIGFNFEFFGCTYNKLKLHGFGIVGFSGNTCTAALPTPGNIDTNNVLTSSSKAWYVIFPFTSTSQNAACKGGSIAAGNVKTMQVPATATSPAVFVIQVTNAPFTNGGSCSTSTYGINTYQVRLYQGTNVIEVHYKQVSNADPYGGADVESGIKGGSTAKYLRYANLYVTGATKTASGLVVQYRPMVATPTAPVPTPKAVNDTYTFDFLNNGPTFIVDGLPHGTPSYTANRLTKNDLSVASASFIALHASGPSGGSLQAASGGACTGSSPAISTDGSFCFTPPGLNPCAEGPYHFNYRVKDAWNSSPVGNVTLQFVNCNIAPVANDDAYSATEDTPVTVAATAPAGACPPAAGPLCNDTDDGQPAVPGSLSALLSAAPLTGAVAGAGLPGVAPGGDGAFTYTPAANVCGTDTFRYQAYDGIARSNNATVTIAIACTPDSPVATDDAYTLDEDTTLAVDSTCLGSLVSPKCNDADPDDQTGTLHRDAAGFSITAAPLHGTIAFPACASCPGGPGGDFAYTPAANYCGTDALQYKLTDDAGMPASAPATIAFTVVCQPDDDAYATVEGEELNVPALGVLANDNDALGSVPMTAVLYGAGPTHTIPSGFALHPDGSFDYAPAAGYVGTDAFQYKTNQGGTLSAPVTATITISPVNPALIARGDTRKMSGADHSFGATEDATVVVSSPVHATVPGMVGVLANDHIADTTTAWSLVLVSLPAHGTVTLRNDGSFDYDASEDDYNGPDNFRYKIVQGAQESNPAIVQVRVASVNDAPIGLSRSYPCIDEDTWLTVAAASGLLVGSTDRAGLPDEGNFPLVPVLATPAMLGTVLVNSDGSFSYTPDANKNGADSFQVRLRDAKGTPLSAPLTISLCVTPKTDPPVAVNDACNAYLGYRKTVAAPGVLGNDLDPDIPNGDTISIVPSSLSYTGPGTFVVNADGSWRYDPDPAMTTAYMAGFTYRIRDSTNQLSNVATVSCSVQPNLPPTAAFSPSSQVALAHEGISFLDASTDPDGTVAAWSWDFGDGYTSTLRSPTHAFAGPGVYLVRLVVADDLGATDDTAHYVEVRLPAETTPVDANEAGQDAPEANAGPDLTVPEGSEVTVHGVVAKGDGRHVQWRLLGGPAVAIRDPTALNLEFTAPVLTSDEPVLLTFSLTVGNDRRDSLPDLVEVLVVTKNHAPEADAGPAATALPGAKVTLDGSRSKDADGDALSYAWRQATGPKAELAGADGPKPSFTLPQAAAGTVLVFELEVRDARGASVDAVQVLVGRAPEAPAGFHLEQGTDGEVRFEAIPEGQYAWFFGDGASSTEAAPAHVYTRSGDYVVTLRVATDKGVQEFSELVRVDAPAVQERARPQVELADASGADAGLWVGLGAAALVAAGLATVLVVGLRKNRAR
ncbi:MAG: hypothetical protein QOD77_513 [Thermoplasmata archaeon]|jgi:PKD repeat protein|nr:hypothetical protein [Thermoplasmata archaeon]